MALTLSPSAALKALMASTLDTLEWSITILMASASNPSSDTSSPSASSFFSTTCSPSLAAAYSGF